MAALSRIILAVILLVVGGMVAVVHRDMGKLSGQMATMSGQIDSLPIMTQPALQRAVGRIGKPRVPPVRHVIRKPSTIIDDLCRS